MGLKLFPVFIFFCFLSYCHSQFPTLPPGSCVEVEKDILRKIPKEGLQGLIQTAGASLSHLLTERVITHEQRKRMDEVKGSRGSSLLPLLNLPDPLCQNVTVPTEGWLQIPIDGTIIVEYGYKLEMLTDLEITGLSTLKDDLSLRLLQPGVDGRESWEFALEWLIDLGSLEVLEDFHNTFFLGLPTLYTNFSLHFDGEQARLFFQDCHIYFNTSGRLALVPEEGKTFFLHQLELQASCPVLDWTATWNIDVGVDVENPDGTIDSALCTIVDNAETDIGEGLAGIISQIWNFPTTDIPECKGYTTGPCYVKTALNLLFKDCTLLDIIGIGDGSCTTFDPPSEGEGSLKGLDLFSFLPQGVKECPPRQTTVTEGPKPIPTLPPGSCTNVEKDILSKIPEDGIERLIQYAGSAFSQLIRERLRYKPEGVEWPRTRGIPILPGLNLPDPFCRNITAPNYGLLSIEINGTDILHLGYHFETLTDLEIIGLSTLEDDFSVRLLEPEEGVRETWEFELEWNINLGSLEVLENFHNTFFLGLPTLYTNFSLHFDGEQARLLFQDCQIYLNASGRLALVPEEGKTFFLHQLELQASCPVLDWTATWNIDVGVDIDTGDGIDNFLCTIVDNAETDIGDGLAEYISMIWNFPTFIHECRGYTAGPCVVKTALNLLFENCTLYDIVGGGMNCTLFDFEPTSDEEARSWSGLDLTSYFTLGVNECPARQTTITEEPTTQPTGTESTETESTGTETTGTDTTETETTGTGTTGTDTTGTGTTGTGTTGTESTETGSTGTDTTGTGTTGTGTTGTGTTGTGTTGTGTTGTGTTGTGTTGTGTTGTESTETETTETDPTGSTGSTEDNLSSTTEAGSSTVTTSFLPFLLLLIFHFIK